MQGKERIVFIINPISGIFHKDKLPALIRKHLDKERFLPEIVFTRYAGHAAVLAAGYAAQGVHCVVAVGGDGTVNEVASALCHTGTALGIIPTGSGNGLARHLRVSLNPRRAIRQLNRSTVSFMDYGLANGHPFFCTCGVGFDARISQDFCTVKKRGFLSYFGKIVRAFFTYEPLHYRVSSEEGEWDGKAFLVTVANASQWGYAARIAPEASVQDGLFDIVVLRRVRLFPALWLAVKLYTHRLGNDRYVKTWKTRELLVHSDEAMPLHVDGDPLGQASEVHLHVVPGGLKVFCAKKLQ